ncbi:MAG: ribulose-phosphate 3-epimerase [Aureliella sp.]
MGKRIGRAAIEQLRGRQIVLPSLLQCDFTNLEREIRRLEEAGVAALHLDVMDGHFVPNLTYGMPIISAVRQLTTLPLDVHLMISDPHKYVSAFVEAGADLLTVHAEVAGDIRLALETIRQAGAAAGVALNPGTDLKVVEALLPLCDLVLIMSVNAGFGGQAFNPVALEKLRSLRERVSPDVLLEVDGGVNLSTIRDCSRAGATLFVVGSAIFGQPDYAAAIAQLDEQLRN